MSTRDELAKTIRPVLADYGAMGTVPPEHPLGLPGWGDRLSADESDCPESIADALIAEGWRKKPSRDEVARAIAWGVDGVDGEQFDEAAVDYRLEMLQGADAVLALMDRGQ